MSSNNKPEKIYDLYLNGQINKPIFIKTIKVKGNNKIEVNDIIKMFTIKENQTLDINKFNQEISKAYRTDYFHYINYEIELNDDNSSNLIINIKENEQKIIKLGIMWDNHYKLIGKLKLDFLNRPLKNFRIQDELSFSGIKSNNLILNYLITKNNRINFIPSIKIKNQIKEFKLRDYDVIISHDLNRVSYGIIIPMLQYGSISLYYNKEKNIYRSLDKENNINFGNIEFDLDQLDDLLHPRDGYKLFLDYNYKVN